MPVLIFDSGFGYFSLRTCAFAYAYIDLFAGLYQIITATTTFKMVYYSITLPFVTILLIGLHKSKRLLVKIFLIVAFMYLIFYFLLYFRWTPYPGRKRFKARILAFGLTIYGLLLVRSYYYKMEDGRAQPTTPTN